MEELLVRNKYRVFFMLAVLFAPALSIKSRSVNLALETSFFFDPQDIKENATFINKIQDVLDKLRRIIKPPAPIFRRDHGREDEIVLTKFLSQIGGSLIKFDNKDLKKITSDLRDAVQELANKNTEFDELFEDDRLRAFFLNTVTIWAETDPMVLKVEIAKYITNVDTDAVIELIRMLNKVFDPTDEPKFKKLTKKFTKAVKNKDFTKFLTKTIDFVIFKRFNKLNFLLKHLIREELRKFTEYVSKEYSNRIVFKSKERHFSLSTIARGESIAADKRGSIESFEKTTLKTERAKGSVTKDGLILEKDLRLNVRTDDKNVITLNMN